jgi:hypothetical protein
VWDAYQSVSLLSVGGESCVAICLSAWFIPESTKRVSLKFWYGGCSTPDAVGRIYFGSYTLTIYETHIELHQCCQKLYSAFTCRCDGGD